MNDIALESFINFCDDMMIAEEGFGINDILHAIDVLIEKLKNLFAKVQSKIRQSKTKGVEGFAISKNLFNGLKAFNKNLNTYYNSLSQVIHNSADASSLLKIKSEIEESYENLSKIAEKDRERELKESDYVNIDFDNTDFGLDKIIKANKLLTDAKDYCRRNTNSNSTIVGYVRNFTTYLNWYYQLVFNGGQEVKNLRKEENA